MEKSYIVPATYVSVCLQTMGAEGHKASYHGLQKSCANRGSRFETNRGRLDISCWNVVRYPCEITLLGTKSSMRAIIDLLIFRSSSWSNTKPHESQARDAETWHCYL